MTILTPPDYSKFLDDLVQSHDLVVVKYTADWCAPCKTYAPVFKKVAKAFEDRASSAAFVEIDTEAFPALCSEDITGIPATAFFVKKGSQTERIDFEVGVLSEKDLKALVDKHLPKPPTKVLKSDRWKPRK